MNAIKLASGVGLVAALVSILWLVLRQDATEAASVAPEAAPGAALVTNEPVLEHPPAEPAADEGAPAEQVAAAPPPEPEPAAARPALAPTSITLYGFLLPSEGRELPAESAISLTDRLGERRVTRAGPDGAYAFGGLAPGEYWLRAGGGRDAEARERALLDGSSTEVRLDLRLALPPQVLVKVVDPDGEPADRLWMLAVATREPPGEWFDEVRGSYNNPFGVGHFYGGGFGGVELPEGYMGKVVLDVEPPVHLSLLQYHRVIGTQRVEPGQGEVLFVVDPESPEVRGSELRLRFVDAATGEPLEPRRVILHGAGGRPMQAVDGELRAQGLPPGWYELSGFVPGYALGFLRVLVEPVAVNDLGAVPLQPELRIGGRVLNEAGEGVATRLSYGLFDEATGRPVRHMMGSSVRSDAEGRFEIRGLGRDVYFLEHSERDSPWGESGRRVDLRAGSVEDLVLELAPGVPLVLRPSGTAVGEVRYRVLDAGGELVRASRLWSEAPQPVLLAPGRYTVEARLGDAAPVRHEVGIGREPVELALP